MQDALVRNFLPYIGLDAFGDQGKCAAAGVVTVGLTIA